MIIAHHTVPRVAHQGKDHHLRHLVRGNNSVNISQSGMFPQPPRRGQRLQPSLAAFGLGRVTDQYVIRHCTRFKRCGQ
jgi:hypothetical protein